MTVRVNIDAFGMFFKTPEQTKLEPYFNKYLETL
jgi:hypothetical protein